MTKKEQNLKELKAKYFELINLVEEHKFNKLNSVTEEQKETCQQEINSLEDRINGILEDVALINKELDKEEKDHE